MVRIDNAAGVMIAAPSPGGAGANALRVSLQAKPGYERRGEEHDVGDEETTPAKEVSRTPTQQQKATEKSAQC